MHSNEVGILYILCFYFVYVVGINNTWVREGQERNKARADLKKLIRKIIRTALRKNTEFRKCLLLKNENVTQ